MAESLSFQFLPLWNGDTGDNAVDHVTGEALFVKHFAMLWWVDAHCSLIHGSCLLPAQLSKWYFIFPELGYLKVLINFISISSAEPIHLNQGFLLSPKDGLAETLAVRRMNLLVR